MPEWWNERDGFVTSMKNIGIVAGTILAVIALGGSVLGFGQWVAANAWTHATKPITESIQKLSDTQEKIVSRQEAGARTDSIIIYRLSTLSARQQRIIQALPPVKRKELEHENEGEMQGRRN